MPLDAAVRLVLLMTMWLVVLSITAVGPSAARALSGGGGQGGGALAVTAAILLFILITALTSATYVRRGGGRIARSGPPSPSQDSKEAEDAARG